MAKTETNMTVKTLEKIEEMREERGINKQTLAECAGASPGSWSHALNCGQISQAYKNNAVEVMKYYDRNGIVPLPGELHLEEITEGRPKKTEQKT